MSEVELEPMSAERFVSWNTALIASFAEEKVRAGNWPAEGALERSAEQCAKELPDGLDSVGHNIFIGAVDGQEIGFLWLHTDPALAVPETFIFDIEVAAEHRGKGYGRGLLEAGERWCVEHGVTALKLHVFGFNTTAIKLYETSGFEITNLNMTKRLSPL
ncbi:MAG: family N-acetyltransferase [Aeromicrobium sp.]|jgi:GNAT superfamily N-acetyltransferase|nr:family N-acetyltransferase [Aeromicrobium sp.]